MAQTNVAVTQGSGKNIDGFTTASAGNVRQAVVIADPSTDANTLTVNASGEILANSNLTKINGVTLSVGSGIMGTGVQRVAIASDNDAITVKQGTGTNLHVILDANSGVDIGKLTANQSVNVSQVNGHTSLEAGVNGSVAVGGSVATNVAIGTNPVNIGAQGVSSENSAVTTSRMVQLVADLVGKLIVLPYANPENFVAGTTSAITDTTSTQVIASAGGSLRNYITSILVTNSHATVGTFVKILDGASIIYEGYAAPAGGGFAVSLPVPLRGTAATAVNAQAVTTGANFIVSAAGYKGL